MPNGNELYSLHMSTPHTSYARIKLRQFRPIFTASPSSPPASSHPKDTKGIRATQKKVLGTACWSCEQAFVAAKPVAWPNKMPQASVFILITSVAGKYSMYVCMDGCMYACMYVCTYVCMYVCMYVCVCVYVCLCIYICMEVWIFIHVFIFLVFLLTYFFSL